MTTHHTRLLQNLNLQLLNDHWMTTHRTRLLQNLNPQLPNDNWMTTHHSRLLQNLILQLPNDNWMTTEWQLITPVSSKTSSFNYRMTTEWQPNDHWITTHHSRLLKTLIPQPLNDDSSLPSPKNPHPSTTECQPTLLKHSKFSPLSITQPSQIHSIKYQIVSKHINTLCNFGAGKILKSI